LSSPRSLPRAAKQPEVLFKKKPVLLGEKSEPAVSKLLKIWLAASDDGGYQWLKVVMTS
jgi:hypothetical protein